MSVQVVSTLLLAIVMIIVLCRKGSSAQNIYIPPIPCPNVFGYVFDGNKYVGIITLRDVSYGQTIVQIDMTQRGNLNSDYSGDISLNFDEDRVRDYIRTGRPITYRVNFPLRNVVPRVTDITVNGVRICSGPEDISPKTSLTLQHTLTVNPGSQPRNVHEFNTGFNHDISDFPRRTFRRPTTGHLSSNDFSTGFKYDNPNFLMPTFRIPTTGFTPDEDQRPGQPGMHYRSTDFSNSFNNGISDFRKPTLRRPTTDVSVHENPFYGGANGFNGPIETARRNSPFTMPPITTTTVPVTFTFIDSICGQENDVLMMFQVNGQVVDKSRFPWIVAIYTMNTSSLNFRCGGNLISTRTVVSAAHCFTEGSETIPSANMLLSLGRHNLRDWQNSVNVGVQRLIIHPDFKKVPHNVDADIAIAQLKDSVSFSLTIRPICLWERNIHDNAVDGSMGNIVGWGEDGSHTGPTEVPKLINATIVSEASCIRSNPALVFITSNRTLCAGNKDGSGPCKGDSGSGLMTHHENKWMLRGIVSASLSKDTMDCNLSEYVIFSDISKFITWIKANMLL